MSRNRYCPTRFPAFIFNPSGADTALQAPLFTWYVGVREKIAAERYRANDDFTALLSDKSVAKAAARAPPRVRAHARLHAVSSGDKDLIDPRLKVMAYTGLAALGQ